MWGRLSDRIGRRPVLIGGLVGTSAAYLLFARAESPALHHLVDSAAALFGAKLSAARVSVILLYAAPPLPGFFGATTPSARAYMADVTTGKDRAKGMGLIGAAFGLGFTFGPLLGGILAKHAPGDTSVPRLPGYLAAGLSLAAATFGYFKLKEPVRHTSGTRL